MWWETRAHCTQKASEVRVEPGCLALWDSSSTSCAIVPPINLTFVIESCSKHFISMETIAFVWTNFTSPILFTHQLPQILPLTCALVTIYCDQLPEHVDQLYRVGRNLRTPESPCNQRENKYLPSLFGFCTPFRLVFFNQFCLSSFFRPK